MPIIAIDTETTGKDFYHGSRPYLVTMCSDEGNSWYEWDVDPITRQPVIPPDDIKQIVSIISRPDNTLVLHNARFDCTALNTILTLPQKISPIPRDGFPWHRVEDTLTAGHVLGSALPHNLTDSKGKPPGMISQYLGYLKTQGYEDRVKEAVKKARDYCRRFLPSWNIARPGKNAPSAGKGSDDEDKLWKNDMWLLRAILAYDSHPEDQQERIEQWRLEWCPEYGYNEDGEPIPIPNGKGAGLTADYANMDSDGTFKLWPVLEAELKRRDLWAHYKERMRLTPLAYRIERTALTVSESGLVNLVRKYDKQVQDATTTCLKIAKEMDFPLTMPKGSSNNNSLKAFAFGEATMTCANCNKQVSIARTINVHALRREGTCTYCKQRSTAIVREWPNLGLPVIKKTETGLPSLDKDSIEQYLGGEELNEVQRKFLMALRTVRGAAKAADALIDYQSYWLPYQTGFPSGYGTWKIIHPNLNPQGTDTLRWNCRYPNLMNISKLDDYNAREAFGPAPGRESWSLDFRNVEKRIPGYECGEETFIDLFERANEPPYFGSDHILKFSVVYPDLWEKALRDYGPQHAANWIKSPEGYKATYYQWIKNTNFALQYECGDAKADKTAHAKGVKKLLSGAFPKEAAMKRYWINFANKHGYVETLPRKSVNPRRGYPLMCKRTEKGGILTTVPLAHHVSGTAMDLTAAAMIACQEQLNEWNRECRIPDHYRMALQVHDELFFDFPKAVDPRVDPAKSNLGRAKTLQKIMEDCGKDFICRRLSGEVVTIPTPVSCEYHPHNWAKGYAL